MKIWEDCINKHYVNNETLEDVYQYYLQHTNNNCQFNSFQARLSNEKTKRGIHNIVGIIGDTHFPFTLKGYLQFCKNTFTKYGVNQVVMIGDLVDNHAMSRWNTEVDAEGGISEYTHAKEMVIEFLKLFPSGKLTIGNHDRIPQRQAATLGLHDGFIKSFNEAWDLPNEWEVAPEFIIDGVKYIHGEGASGKSGTINMAVAQGCSVFCGHNHTRGGVSYHSNGNFTIFGGDSGCGIDYSKYAFRYAKFSKDKPVIGCGVVIDGIEAQFIPMLID